MIAAIDQGSTKTQVLIGDEHGTVRGVGLAEGACHFHVGMEASMRAVRAAAEVALADAGLDWRDVTGVNAGMSGANWPEEVESLRSELAQVFQIPDVTVYNDCIVALRAGSGRKDAVVLCAGTAFNAAVRKDGEIVLLYNNFVEKEDEGGKGLSQRALQRVFRSLTRMGPETSLAARAMEYFGYRELHPMLLDFDRGTLSTPVKGFAVIVDEEAAKGDPVALDLLYEFGVSLSRYATAALVRFGLLKRDVDVVLTGGIFKARARVLVDAVRTEVHRVAPKAEVVQALYEPVVGAYQLALEASGQPGWAERLQASAERFSLHRIPK